MDGRSDIFSLGTVLYETLASHPETTLGSIVKMLDLGDDAVLPVHDGNLTVAKVGHTIGGNPRRPRLGTTAVELDERWKVSGSRLLRASGPVMTPLWHHYKRLASRSARAAT